MSHAKKLCVAAILLPLASVQIHAQVWCDSGCVKADHAGQNRQASFVQGVARTTSVMLTCIGSEVDWQLGLIAADLGDARSRKTAVLHVVSPTGNGIAELPLQQHSDFFLSGGPQVQDAIGLIRRSAGGHAIITIAHLQFILEIDSARQDLAAAEAWCARGVRPPKP